MSAPVRFLFVTVGGWVLFRTASAWMGPAPLTPIPLPPVPTSPMAELTPSPAALAGPNGAGGIEPESPAMPQPVQPAAIAAAAPGMFYYPAVAMSRPAALRHGPFDLMPARWDGGAPLNYGSVPPSEEWPMQRTMPTARLQTASLAAAAAAPSPLQTTPDAPAGPARLDRWALAAWGLFRQPQLSTPNLASGGTLGGSQGGLRLTYAVNRSLAVVARFSAPADQKSMAGEGAVGVAWRPLRGVPLQLVAERRQRLGILGNGRNAWALFAEGGIYDRRLPLGLRLDGYAQAGMVGARRRDLFADGGFAVTRPFMKRFGIGGGMWGGIQPGLSRLDAGPRLSLQWNRNIKIHLDYRYKLLGNAQPGSGPAITVGADW